MMIQKTLLQDVRFGGKPETLVHKLIEGPGVFICDECINLCYDLIDQTSSLNSPNPASQPESKLLPKPEEIKAKLDDMLSAKMMLKLHCR